MKTHKLELVFSLLVFLALLLSACGAANIVKPGAGGSCPPGYIPVYDEQIGAPGYCQLNPNPPATVWPDKNLNCPPGYHLVSHGDVINAWYCQLDPTPTPSPVPQADDSGPPMVKPVMITVTPFPNGKCPPGYHKVSPANEFPQLDYCQIDPTPSPPFQADNSGIPDLKPVLEVVQFCANVGANLGGVNISFPSDNSLHVEDWFSDKPGHVKCTDDVGNPRTCWGPESASFEVLLCTSTLGQNQNSACQTLPVTLGSCAEDNSKPDPDPIPTTCGHC
jgi:hypothetical protein